MNFTYVVRPGEAPEGRGPQLEPFWSFCVNYNLRLGLLIQMAAYATLLATTSSGGRDPLSLLSFFRCNPETAGGLPLACPADEIRCPGAPHVKIPSLHMFAPRRTSYYAVDRLSDPFIVHVDNRGDIECGN